MTVPVDVLPDSDFAKAKDLMLYQYAPGTKTLGAQELDVTKKKYEQDALQAALALKENARQADLQNTLGQGQLAETTRANNMDYTLRQGTLTDAANKALASVVATNAKTTPDQGSAKADALIIDMNTKRSQVANPAAYNYMWHVQRAMNQGWWGTLSKTDQDRVIKAAQSLTGKD